MYSFPISKPYYKSNVNNKMTTGWYVIDERGPAYDSCMVCQFVTDYTSKHTLFFCCNCVRTLNNVIEHTTCQSNTTHEHCNGEKISTKLYQHDKEMVWKIEDIEYLFLEYTNEWYTIHKSKESLAHTYIKEFLSSRKLIYIEIN